MLLTARLGGGVAPEQSPRPCDLRVLCESVAAAARARDETNVVLEVAAEESLRPLVCDEDLLRRVLANLVENAIKYSRDGSRVELRVVDGADAVSIEVRDEGLGIPPSEQERIFEKFYRLDAAMTRGVGGSGLGLYIARELVEAMGGSLTLRSTPGTGSTFAVTLPRATARPTSPG
jgi:signal transduction histidine kinase